MSAFLKSGKELSDGGLRAKMSNFDIGILARRNNPDAKMGGLLTSDVLFIDTSKIRICRKGKVDFKKNRIDVTVAPTAKRPEFFNLATPIKMKGSLADVKLRTKKGALLGTTAKFISSPIHVPKRRAVSEKIPRNGEDACEFTLGPENCSEISVMGCS